MKFSQMSREFRWVIFALIVANTSSRMTQPFVPLYLETLGASIIQVGFYFTLQAIFGITFRILGGWVSDNVGRLPIMAVGSFLGTIATLAFVLAPTWELAILSALLSGMASSLIGPSYQAYVAQEAPEGAVGSAFGLIESLFLICQIIGPLLGGFLVQNTGYKIMLWLAFIIMVVATVIRIWLARGKPLSFAHLNFAKLSGDMRKTAVILLAGGILTWLFISDGLLDASLQTVMPFMPKYATQVAGITESGYGAVFAILSVVAVLTNWLGGNFSDRYGEHISIAIGAGIGALAFVIIALSASALAIATGFGLIGLSTAFIQPAFASLLSKATPKDQLGVMYGVFQTALGFMAIPAPTIGGELYDRVGPQATLGFGIILSLTAIPLSLIKLKPSRILEKQKEGT